MLLVSTPDSSQTEVWTQELSNSRQDGYPIHHVVQQPWRRDTWFFTLVPQNGCKRIICTCNHSLYWLCQIHVPRSSAGMGTRWFLLTCEYGTVTLPSKNWHGRGPCGDSKWSSKFNHDHRGDYDGICCRAQFNAAHPYSTFLSSLSSISISPFNIIQLKWLPFIILLISVLKPLVPTETVSTGFTANGSHVPDYIVISLAGSLVFNSVQDWFLANLTMLFQLHRLHSTKWSKTWKGYGGRDGRSHGSQLLSWGLRNEDCPKYNWDLTTELWNSAHGT